jgi:hypothetical protein
MLSVSGGPKVFCLSRQPTGVGAAGAGAPAGAQACAPWRRRERPGGPPYRKFSHRGLITGLITGLAAWRPAVRSSGL